jgi:AraC family L-rhamnose operon regulatory protein RhaS
VQPVTYRSGATVLEADTCEHLAAAAGRGEIELSALVRDPYPGDPLGPELPGIRTVGTWDARHDQGWGLPWHRNEGIELTLLSRGRLGFATDEGEHALRPGDLTITRPWQRHRVGDPHVTTSRLHWLILDVGVRRPNQTWTWPSWLLAGPAELERLTTFLRHNEHPVWQADAETREAFERATAERRPGRLAVRINELVLALTDLLEHRTPSLDPSLTSSERTVELFLQRLQDELDHPWTLDAMAAECGLGRTRFSHYCKRLTNLTPRDYLVRARVRRARELLEQGASSVTQVSYACGFASSQYFATVFRRHEGHAPRDHLERGGAGPVSGRGT